MNKTRLSAIGVIVAVALVFLFRNLFPSSTVDETVYVAALGVGFAVAWAVELTIRLVLPRKPDGK